MCDRPFLGSSSLEININTGCIICLCGLKFNSELKEKCPDHLKNWELWMKRRQQMHQKLTKKLNCMPGELVMNSGDSYRGIREERLVLGYTQIENHFDKYRGNPAFFSLPPCLKSHEPPFKGTEYFLTRFKVENNQIPDIEYVVVPNVILDEKDIRPRTRQLKNLWAESPYREQMVKKISKRLLEIEPHKPILSDLMIIGTKIGPKIEQESSFIKQEVPKRSSSNTTDIKVVYPNDQSIEEFDQFYESKISLKINNKEYNKYSSFIYKENKISVIFEHFTDSLVSSQKSIIFENTGLVTIRLYWKYFKKLKAFRDYTDKSAIFHPFKFDKRELLLMPGVKKELLVCFQVENPGNYFEYWKITSKPKIWTTDFHLLILFKGFASIRNYEERVRELNERLEQRMRNTIIKDVLNDIIVSGTYCKPTLKQSFDFTEKELFESANLIKHSSPKYVYDASIIAELKKFYQEIRSVDDPKQWDLSIKQLGEVARKKDIFSYFDRKLELFKKAKLKRKDLDVVNVQTKTNIGKETKKASEKIIKDVTQQEEEIIQSMVNYKNLQNILRKLEKPSIYINKERKKYLFSYVVINTYFSKMFNELGKLTPNPEKGKNSEDSINKAVSKNCQYRYYNKIPERLIYEIFDERYILRTKKLPTTLESVRAKPKSVILAGASMTDTKRVFKLYFSKDETPQKVTKDKSHGVEAKKSGGLKGQKIKIPTDDEDLSTFVNENFDPFFEKIPPLKPIKESSNTETISLLQTKEIDKDKYIIVYTILCQAIDALEDTIGKFKDKNIASSTLNELLKCDHFLKEAAFAEDKSLVNSVPSSNVSHKSYQKETVNQEYVEYLEFLKELHWSNNLSIKKYYLSEQKYEIPLESKTESDIDLKSQVNESVLNIFSLENFKRKTEPYCLKERAIQTNLTENVDETIWAKRQESNTESTESLEKPRNVFYFLKNSSKKENEENLLD